MQEDYKNIVSCRLCGSNNLKEVVHFEPQYIASTFVKTNKNKIYPKIPLTLVLCDSCKLVQLKETVNPELLYKNYFYRSNVSDTMNRDLRDVVRDACSRVRLTPSDWILDIGCNDGLMLTMFPRTVNKQGIDPAENIDRTAIKFDDNTEIITGYFPDSITGTTHQFKIITATAMFYDLDDPNRAVQEIKALLHPEGVAVIQVSYLYDTIKDMNFYDICHEHLEYYSLATLRILFERNGLYIVDASTNAVNGGSLRIIVGHYSDPLGSMVQVQTEEKQLILDEPLTYKKFADSVQESALKVRNYIKEQKSVIGLGASTKGNVMLQICGIGKDSLPYISERNPFKVGLRTLGSDIELISEEAARKMNPDAMFVVPWNFKEEIVAREQEYIQNGGKLLFIMPYPYYIDRNGEHRL